MTAVAAALLLALVVRSGSQTAVTPVGQGMAGSSASMAEDQADSVSWLASRSGLSRSPIFDSAETSYLNLRDQVLRYGVDSWRMPVSAVAAAKIEQPPLSYREQLDRLLTEEGSRGSYNDKVGVGSCTAAPIAVGAVVRRRTTKPITLLLRSKTMRVIAGIFAVLAAVLSLAALNQDTALAAPETPEEQKTVQIVLYPAAEPRPAMKYQLLPPFLERRPGNAAVWWNRLPAEREGFFNEFYEENGPWDEESRNGWQSR